MPEMKNCPPLQGPDFTFEHQIEIENLQFKMIELENDISLLKIILLDHGDSNGIDMNYLEINKDICKFELMYNHLNETLLKYKSMRERS